MQFKIGTDWQRRSAVGVLIAVFLGQSFAASLRKSPAFDEPPHIASGLSYVATHTFNANPQHPPLLKELSALSLYAAGVRWPDSDSARQLTSGASTAALEWPIGNEIIAANPDRVLFWARLPFIILSGVLGLLIYLAGRSIFGAAAGLGALLLFALDPTVIGHSFLVTTDIGVTTFAFLFLYLLWRYLERPSWPRIVACGAALGAALAAKFTAVFLLPIAAVLLAVGRRRNISKAIVPIAAMCAAAFVVVEAAYFFGSPSLYLAGMGRLNADHMIGQLAYFNGALAPRFLSYFAAAYVLKTPLAILLLAAGGVALVWKRRSTQSFTKWFLLLPPAVFVLVPTLLADNLGVRYVMPAMPFAYLFGGVALATLFASPQRWAPPAGVALTMWLAVQAVGIYPDHISYFNEAACLFTEPAEIGVDGGTRCGPLWMDESNVDWGQSVKQLREWVRTHSDGRPLRIAYFGSFPPKHYGLDAEHLDPETLLSRPPPGLYAISAFWVGRVPAAVESVAPGATSWLTDTPPAAVVGHAFYIYDLK